MLWRKQEKPISEWIKHGKRALLVSGARQVGKTFLLKYVLEHEHPDFVYFNLIENPTVKEFLKSSSGLDSKTFVNRLSLLSDHPLHKGETIVFFDEIQEDKEITTRIKFLVEEGSFRYVLSGSLLGVELTGLKSAPVGYLDLINMYPLDFKEFAISLGITNDVLSNLHECFKELKPVDPFIHERLLEAFKNYLVVGGMPSAVMEYCDGGDYQAVSTIHKNIIEQYKMDFTKYEKEKKLKLIKTFDLIPSELAEKNKRYQFSDLGENIKFDRYENSFNWLIDAGVALPVFNVTEPRLPLEINKKSSLFKLFMSDCGLLSSQYGKATQLAILNGDNILNCGATYEDVVAQELIAHGFKCYFFNNKKQGELDFVIEDEGAPLPLEIKSGKDYHRHSALDNVLGNPNYGIKKSYVLCNGNIENKDPIIYLPIYMIMFIDTALEKAPTLKKTDLSNL